MARTLPPAWISILLLSALGAAPAVAGSTAAQDPRLPWSDKKAYRECDQSCLYQKANENLSLEVIDGMRLLRELRELPRSDDVLDRLPGFCLRQSESGKECLARYERMMEPILRQMQQGLGNHSDMVMRLKSEGAAVAPRAVEPAGLKDEANKRVHTPYLPTTEELEAQAARLRRLVSPDYQRLAERMSRAPAPEEFVKFKQVDKNPGESGGEKTDVMEMDAQGRPVVDQKAYKRALDRWKASKADVDRDVKLLLGRQAEPPQPSLPVDPERRQAYSEARAHIVSSANEKLGGKRGSASRELDFPGKATAVALRARTEGRAPAAGPSKPATGKEAVIAPAPGAKGLFMSVSASALDRALLELDEEREP